jgi:glutamate dehydrogenase
MFNTPGTQWSDYRREALGKGGGVFERAAKEIELTPEVKKLLGLTASEASGPDLVREILALDVDLMWFGGIGTYVKAATESHGEVGDKVNDNVRINATDLRAKVLGEGANLAITQRGRTEYLLHGGRCNTDAIDNSAGVDCSDHEVNLKILLRAHGGWLVDARGARRAAARARARCRGRVPARQLPAERAALDGSRAQSQARQWFLDLLSYLDKHGLDRAAERIPPDEELRGWLAAGAAAAQPARGARRAHEDGSLQARAAVADSGPAAVQAIPGLVLPAGCGRALGTRWRAPPAPRDHRHGHHQRDHQPGRLRCWSSW